jgi:hypothetical protein
MLKQFDGFEMKEAGWAPVTSVPQEVWDNAMKNGIPHIQGFNIITDAFQHRPKGKTVNGVRLSYTKRGVRLFDQWMGGSIELNFHSMREASVYAKGWTA